MATKIGFVMQWLIVILISSFAFTCQAQEKIEKQKMSTGEDPGEFIKRKILSHDVMVFAQSYGPHNAKTKEILKKMQELVDIHVELLDVDLLPGWDGSLIMTELQAETGQWAFPNIFIGKKHVGGNSNLEQLHALGELEDMLRDVANEEL